MRPVARLGASALRPLGEGPFDLPGKPLAGWRGERPELGDDAAVAGDEVFLKIPKYSSRDGFVGVGCEELVERSLMVTLHGDLGEHVEGDVETSGAELLNLRV